MYIANYTEAGRRYFGGNPIPFDDTKLRHKWERAAAKAATAAKPIITKEDTKMNPTGNVNIQGNKPSYDWLNVSSPMILSAPYNFSVETPAEIPCEKSKAATRHQDQNNENEDFDSGHADVSVSSTGQNVQSSEDDHAGMSPTSNVLEQKNDSEVDDNPTMSNGSQAKDIKDSDDDHENIFANASGLENEGSEDVSATLSTASQGNNIDGSDNDNVSMTVIHTQSSKDTEDGDNDPASLKQNSEDTSVDNDAPVPNSNAEETNDD